MNDKYTSRSIRYYASFQLIYVALVVILSSIGAFFHFLLDHEISIVESWLHNNHWEILITSKLISLYLLNRWFSMRLYELKTIRTLLKELIRYPEPKAIVVPIFMLLSYLTLSDIQFISQNVGYWYFHFISFFGLFLYFGIEFVVLAYLEDVLNDGDNKPRSILLGIIFTIFFSAAYRLSVPDYYGLLPFVVLCYSTLIFVSGRSYKNWSNVLCFLLLFVAPMGALFGLDPVWGDDFSPFKVERKLNFAFLAVIWVISFCYYKYRDQFLGSTRKLLRLR